MGELKLFSPSERRIMPNVTQSMCQVDDKEYCPSSLKSRTNLEEFLGKNIIGIKKYIKRYTTVASYD